MPPPPGPPGIPGMPPPSAGIPRTVGPGSGSGGPGLPPPRPRSMSGDAQPGPSAGAGSEPRRLLTGFLYSFQEDAYGKHWVLHEGENLVGRAETNVKCDVPVAHGTTSTRHATIRCNDLSLSIQDMKSTNGTYVNGRRLDPNMPVQLTDGDKIRFGGYTVHLMLAKNRA
jgi:hypothetical protein